jgi:hypothetical protein
LAESSAARCSGEVGGLSGRRTALAARFGDGGGANCIPFQTERFEPAFLVEHLFEGEEIEVRAASPAAGDKGT